MFNRGKKQVTRKKKNSKTVEAIIGIIIIIIMALFGIQYEEIEDFFNPTATLP